MESMTIDLRSFHLARATVLAVCVFAVVEWLRPWLFWWSPTGLLSVIAVTAVSLGSVWVQSERWPCSAKLAASAVLIGVIGWWSLWVWWLGRPSEASLHRLVIPLGVCVLTSWLLLELATEILRTIRESRVPTDTAHTWCWLPLVGLAGDLWLRLVIAHPGFGLLAAGLWSINRVRPILRTSWWFLAESRWGVVILLGLAFVLRAALAWRLEHAGLDPAVLDGPDSGYYHAAASALAAGKISLWQPSWLLYPRHNPGPVFLYGLLYALVGPQVIAIRVVQLVMAVWSCLLVYGIAKRLFHEAVARLALFLVAGRGYLIAYGSYVGAETPGLFCAVLCVWWWLCLIQEDPNRVSRWRRAGWMIGSGLAASWLTLFRPEFLPLPLVVGLVSWRRLPLRNWKLWAVIVGLSLLLPGLWIVRNGLVHHVWSLQAARTLGFSSWPRLDRLGVLTHPVNPVIPSDAPTTAPVPLPAGLDWRQVAQRPMEVVMAGAADAGEKTLQLWAWRPYVFSPGLVYIVHDEPFIVLISLVLGVGFIAGLWAGRRSKPGLSVLYALLATKTLIHACSVVAQWHRFTMEPFVNIVQAGGLVALVSWMVAALDRRPAAAIAESKIEELAIEPSGEPWAAFKTS